VCVRESWLSHGRLHFENYEGLGDVPGSFSARARAPSPSSPPVSRCVPIVQRGARKLTTRPTIVSGPIFYKRARAYNILRILMRAIVRRAKQYRKGSTLPLLPLSLVIVFVFCSRRFCFSWYVCVCVFHSQKEQNLYAMTTTGTHTRTQICILRRTLYHAQRPE